MSYNKMAKIYDQLMDHVSYDDWVKFLTKILEEKNLQIEKIVDLGCGTGEITIQLAKRGFDVTGVDKSEDMLAVGSHKSIERQVLITWIQQDIRHLSGFKQVDLFVSFCDVINYITKEADLLSVFQTVYHSLNEEGYFIFDVHSMNYVSKKLTSHTFAEVTDEITYIWECVAGENVGEMYHYLTFFTKKKNNVYERFMETHHQRTWDVNQYKQFLKKTGFTKIEFYGDFTLDKAISQKMYDRIFILAKK